MKLNRLVAQAVQALLELGARRNSLSLSHTHTHSLDRSYTHTHTHTHTHSHTHTHTHTADAPLKLNGWSVSAVFQMQPSCAPPRVLSMCDTPSTHSLVDFLTSLIHRDVQVPCCVCKVGWTGPTCRHPLSTKPTAHAPGDIGIRFSKFQFIDKTAPVGFLPVGTDDYPMVGKTAQVLKDETNADSVVTPDDAELGGKSAADYIHALGGCPAMPNADPNHSYWKQLEAVVDLQIFRRGGGAVDTLLTLPRMWQTATVDDVAQNVRGEYPGWFQQTLIQWLWTQNVELDHEIVPFRSMVDFVGTQVRMADINMWAIREVACINFHMKWTCGLARPEEVAYMIATDRLQPHDGVPTELVRKIKSMNLTNPEDFTAFAGVGCPRHPSWPAMHAASSAASLWLAVVLHLTADQYCEALRLDYAVAFGRSVAGVHYLGDNTAGLNLGQLIVAERLADHLAATYGSNRTLVQAKIQNKLVDWTKFDSRSCSFPDGAPAPAQVSALALEPAPTPASALTPVPTPAPSSVFCASVRRAFPAVHQKQCPAVECPPQDQV